MLLTRPLRRALPLITVLTVIWVGGWGLLVAGTERPIGPDGPVDRFLIDRRGHLNAAATVFGDMSRPHRFAVLLVVLVGVCLAIRSVRAAVLTVVAIGVDLVAVEIIKEVVRRHQAVPGLTFPSGHAATATVIATVAILVCHHHGPAGRHLPRAARLAVTVVAVALVVAVSASVIILQDHYFSDTLAAVPLGAAITLLLAAAVDSGARRISSQS